ncbi:MAG: hypothetical protein E7317_09230 [Clostridiales bacterium]|nr:hypothetical protein [Clostridiales bacterium]
MAAKVKQQLIMQFGGRDFDLTNLEAEARKAWKDAGKKVGDLESIDIYVKPEEAAAYYVVNKEVEGKIEL